MYCQSRPDMRRARARVCVCACVCACVCGGLGPACVCAGDIHTARINSVNCIRTVCRMNIAVAIDTACMNSVEDIDTTILFVRHTV